MDNTEAIEIIKTAIAKVEWDYPMEYAAALDKAVEALKEQEPVKPITTGKGILERTRCGACGSEIAKSHFYCWYCGRKAKWDD